MPTPKHNYLTPILIVTTMVLLLLGCASLLLNTPDNSPTPPQTTSQPSKTASSDSAYALAQATIDAGQKQLLDLSRKATEVSLNSSQAADAAALSTQDANHRQKIELDYQSTLVSLNMAQAAATQSYFSQQTKTAKDAAAAATRAIERISGTQTGQAQTALDALALQTAQAAATLTAYPLTATYSAHAQNVTQTVQAQMMLYGQATQAAQAIETQTAYPSTATAVAVTQAALLMQKYDREQRSFVNQIVTPLIPILVVLDLLLFILIILWEYRRFLPMPRSPRLWIAPRNVTPSPLMIIDGRISDPDPQIQQAIPDKLLPVNPSGLPVENKVHVEIIDAVEPPVAQWITEVEHQLADEGGLTR